MAWRARRAKAGLGDLSDHRGAEIANAPHAGDPLRRRRVGAARADARAVADGGRTVAASIDLHEGDAARQDRRQQFTCSL